MDTRRLEYFVAVAEDLNFTTAAARLFAAQSTVSAGIKVLEAELGATLFERSTRQVTLSEAGEALLPEARALLAAQQRAREAVRESSAVLRGRVRIGTLSSMGLIDLPGLLGEFHRRHPQVDVQLRTSPTGSTGLAEDLRHGRLDVALLGLPTADLGGIDAREVTRIPYVALLPSGHPAGGQDVVELADLAGERFVDTLPGFGNRIEVDGAFAAAGVRRHVATEVADLSIVADYVAAGLGVAVVPRLVLKPREGVLARPVHPGMDWIMYVATAAGRPSSRAARAVLDLIASRPPAGPAFLGR